MSSENVFSIVQLGSQLGTTQAPGAAVAATFMFPIDAKIHPDLNLGSAYPVLDRGRNIEALAASGYHGIRESSVTLPAQVRFEDIMAILDMHNAGGVTPTGVNPYTWVFPFEAVVPTIRPATLETGNTDLALAQERMTSVLVDALTLGFARLTPGQASPWTLSATLMGFDRAVNPITAALAPKGANLETVQGHLTHFYEGPVATAFSALVEVVGTLKSFTMTSSRFLRARAYGSSADLATAWGFHTISSVSYTLEVAVNTTTKTDLHDVWNTTGASLGERRIRIQANGTASKQFTIDARAGMFAIPWDDADGERVYKISGRFADDATLNAPHTITIVNTVAS